MCVCLQEWKSSEISAVQYWACGENEVLVCVVDVLQPGLWSAIIGLSANAVQFLVCEAEAVQQF